MSDKETEVSKAFNVLKKSMNDDSSYAHGWHCNIAMMCYDAIKEKNLVSGSNFTHIEALEVGNEAASRFMKLCFDVETSQEP